MSNANTNTNAVENKNIKIADITSLEAIVNASIISKNLGYIDNIAKSQETKNNLVQEIFNDYLANKSEYKTLMITLGYKEDTLKNKAIAKFYFESQIKVIGSKLFSLYGIEIKPNEKSYTLINTKKSIDGQNIIKGAKEYLKNTFTLLELISTNNLKLRIKLIDFSTLKSILNNLAEEIDGQTVKAMINNLDINLNDNSYIKALKGILRSIKKEVKTGINFDITAVKSVAEADILIEALKARKLELLNGAKPDISKDEVNEDITISDTLEITE